MSDEIEGILKAIDESWHVAALKLRGEIESLRQQVAECQARERALREAVTNLQVQLFNGHVKLIGMDALTNALSVPIDSTALDAMLKQAKRDALLEVAESFDKDQPAHSASAWIGRVLRDKAGELK